MAISVLALSSVLTLSGCVAEALPQVESPSAAPTTPAPATPCLGAVSYPDVNAQPLTLGLPLDGVLADYLQSEVLITRGDGDCDASPPSIGNLPDRCAAPAGTGESALGVMLWSVSDELTEAMFASGADRAITELVTGYVGSTDHPFMFRTTAWRFPDGVPATTPAFELLRGCDASSEGQGSMTLFEGDEPAAVYSSHDSSVFLFESIHPMTPAGEVASLPLTDSGLLPGSAVDAIRTWWTSIAPEVLRSGQQV